MNGYIEVINQLKPKNNATFPLADVNDLRGGYIQVDTIEEMNSFPTSRLKVGMLCYVKDDPRSQHMYQFSDANVWVQWSVSGSGGGGGMSIVVVETYEELLLRDDLRLKGQLVYVEDIESILYYTGTNWQGFPRIYIQDTPPEDTQGIWIDTSEDKSYINSNTVIQELLQVISILQEKIKKIEYAFNCEMDFGDFSNNKYDEYDGQPNEEPNYGTSEEYDNGLQEALADIPVADAPEPTEYNEEVPNAKHLKIKSGTYAQMQEHKDDFATSELLWCYDTQTLYIKDPKTYELIKIGASGGEEPEPEPDIMDGILTEIIDGKTKIKGIEFIDINNTDNTYLIQIKDGKLDVHDYRLDTNNLAGNSQTTGTGNYYTTLYFPITSANVGSTDSPKIYVNMIYCGADSNKYSYNPVSHNFVELCNLGNTDLNLKGLYLHYTERNTGDWVTLPLIGTIKSGHTFLIKGSQCSVENVNTTLIKVGEPDMYWTKEGTLHNDVLEVVGDDGAGVQSHSIWGDDGLIKFAYNCSFYLSGAESSTYFDTNVLQTSAPYNNGQVLKWYVDLIGIGKYESTNMPSESAPFATNGSNILLMRYYNMDGVKQATKAVGSRKNTSDWTYINMNNINPEIDIQKYTPANSTQDKDVFFNKHLLTEGKPNIITCTFGYNAHTTRCFTWVSVGYYDEFIMIKKDGEEGEWETFESFKEGDERDGNSKNWDNPMYNRLRSITTDGTPFTVHRFIKDFEEPISEQKYIYKVGRDGAWSEERSFTLKNREQVISNGFKFLQVTDQQGFNAEEYKTWEVSAQFINNEEQYDFCINTGDATQNGNRINEWVDYFNAGDSIFNHTEQMYTVGNNDLCPVDVYQLGDGSDIAKTNPINIEYFFTFEYPFEIPQSSAGVYVPSVYSFIYGNTYFLSMNSEITTNARTDIFKDEETNVYDDIKAWCDSDLTHCDEKIQWKVAFCHEAPFTIVTADLIMSYLPYNESGSYTPNMEIKRGGSHLNTVGNYWFSKFLQDNQFKLCLCGHKHTYANSRYICDDPEKTMAPIVYSTIEQPEWFTSLSERNKQLCQISTDTSKPYVRYVMCQATGYKLTSNKELPSQNIPWLLEYYPVSTQQEDNSTNTATVKVNTAQQYPNYIIWNIGEGEETETVETTSNRSRILGKSYKLQLSSDNKVWSYKYNVPIKYTDLKKVGGNGATNADNNIIIEKTL